MQEFQQTGEPFPGTVTIWSAAVLVSPGISPCGILCQVGTPVRRVKGLASGLLFRAEVPAIHWLTVAGASLGQPLERNKELYSECP